MDTAPAKHCRLGKAGCVENHEMREAVTEVTEANHGAGAPWLEALPLKEESEDRERAEDRMEDKKMVKSQGLKGKEAMARS